ncbi:MAG: TonB-dependent receptor plug domain-containing protein [Opitutaceae bacterium]|nr:TonB-dependent receptor plug domain-containing protein [Opitutaceae bacterium]
MKLPPCPPSSFAPALLAAALLPALLRAQTTPPASRTEEIVVLSPFEVSSSQPSRYQADESASGGRIRASIMDTPATVTVLTNEFIQDVGTLRVLDAAKYVAGISEATIPNGLDRVNIRGFQSDGRRVDGFSTNDQANYDAAGIERMEVIKGPDALLQPAGVPGGTINLVTKRPRFTFGGSVKVQLGAYDANRVEADVTGPLSGQRLAYRVVASHHDSDGYTRNLFRRSNFVAPSLTWRIAANTSLTVRYEHYDFKTSTLEGLPVDPSVGTTSEFKLLPGIPLDFSPALGEDDQYRKVQSHTGTFLLTSTLTDRLSVRLAGRAAEIDTPDSGFGWGPNTQGGSRNPRTGLWEGGLIYATSAPFAATAAPALSATYTHAGTNQGQKLRYRDLQNDWAYTIDGSHINSTTLVGFAYGFEHQNLQAATQSTAAFTPTAFTPITAAPTVNALNTDRRRQTTRNQSYLTEKIELFDRRLILSGGVAHIAFNGFFGNKLSAATSTAVAGQMYPGDGSTTTVNYGVVAKPAESLSVYFGHTENAVPASNYQQTAAGTAPLFSEGTQDEVGLKVQLLNKRLLASIAYYEISQTGYSIANPANLTSPPPAVLLPALVVSREASGWEFQIAANLSRNLSLIASYADTTNRDPNGVPFRGSAEKMGALFVRYEFKDGPLTGVAVGLGANYLGKRAGDQASGLTPASTSTAVIPNQPSFYLPARTLTDLNVSYSRGRWNYPQAVNNLYDKVDYAASQTRFSVYIGNPLSLSGSAAWTF